jgi:hypothetical protein
MRHSFPPRSLAISRTLDGAHLSAIANTPDVRPYLLMPTDGELDLRALVADPRNYCFETPFGGFLGIALGYGRYEVHSLFVPTRAPKVTVTAMREASEYIFTRTDCVELVTKVPEGNRRAGQLAAVAHFEERFVAPVAPGHQTRARYLALSLDQWTVHGCGLAAIGQWFHDAFDQMRADDVLALAGHPEDAGHNQFVGAAILMINGGQVEKGIGFYNRWARWVGYPTIGLVSLIPTVIDLGAGIIAEVRGQEMEVLSCP